MAAHTLSHERKWWKEAVIYQIYPSSFYDSNGDGIGDIPGIINKLPYLAVLGVNAIWLSPHYASPQHDMGYDVSNYEEIYPPYGTVEQTQHLIDACHAQQMKIIFDLVINHTSSEHPWFKESRSSKSNPKREFYHWKPPKAWKDGVPLPPNNWESGFGGSAWEFDENTQEFYLHLYATTMPDLNWEKAETRKAIYESSMHFWLRRGVDGFRVDVVNKYSKDVTFGDAPIVDPGKHYQPCFQLNSNGPRMHEFLSEMHEVLSEYRTFDGGEIMTVGELPYTAQESDVRSYVSAAQKQLNMVFNFEAVYLGHGPEEDRSLLQPFSTRDFKEALSMWETFVNGTDAWTTVFLENHDLGRSISRFGNDETENMRERSGKLLAIILGSMTGTLFIYQGQEIGMTNIPEDWSFDEYKDSYSISLLHGLIKSGASPNRMRQALQAFQKIARDNARTPMQWNNSPNAGFSKPGSTPWMRVNDNYLQINASKQEEEDSSVLSFWRRMLRLRKQHVNSFVYGTYRLLPSHDDIFSYQKGGEDGEKVLVVANMSSKAFFWRSSSEVLITNLVESGEPDTLLPWEARIYIQT